MHETLYHYSPQTGKPERCTAHSRESCPYSQYFHSTNYNECLKKADEYNGHSMDLQDNFDRLISTDWTVSQYSPVILTKNAKEACNRIRLQTLIKNKVISRLFINHEEDFAIMPHTKDALQKYFGHNGVVENMIDYVNEGIKNRELRLTPDEIAATKGRMHTYDKWELLDLVEYAKDPAKNIMNKPILCTGPRGTKNYTLTQIWNDYKQLKIRKHEMFEVMIEDQKYIIVKP